MENDNLVDDYVPLDDAEEEFVDQTENDNADDIQDLADQAGYGEMFDDRYAMYGAEIEDILDKLFENSSFMQGATCTYIESVIPTNMKERTYYLVFVPAHQSYNEHWIGICRVGPSLFYIFDSYGQDVLDILHERRLQQSSFAHQVLSSHINGDLTFTTLTPRVQNINSNTCGKYQVLYGHLFDTVQGNAYVFQDRLDQFFTPITQWSSSTASFNNDATCEKLFDAITQHL